ncbi:hypothetical protein BQ8794_240127 [Mesorhizobium prunaredense]|uniref:Uncharacterized protein n=3 Tax=Mesorhizobium TaxID=68287 RepID=A0A1R3V9H1_9HYPH|nr:conserved hypothetical protein [Mesorhizobium escarrei]SIT55920.1 hypothetical protein BQ8794_240127 [Mesorhizobium prunaredense]SJM34710.1 hypothetical protein BQ8482_490049 [Mesorhizobium delmotii]
MGEFAQLAAAGLGCETRRGSTDLTTWS